MLSGGFDEPRRRRALRRPHPRLRRRCRRRVVEAVVRRLGLRRADRRGLARRCSLVPGALLLDARARRRARDRGRARRAVAGQAARRRSWPRTRCTARWGRGARVCVGAVRPRSCAGRAERRRRLRGRRAARGSRRRRGDAGAVGGRRERRRARRAARRTRSGSRGRSRMAWGCRTSRWICGRSSGRASSTRSWPATRRGRPRIRAWAATGTCGWTRCSPSPSSLGAPYLATGHYARVTDDGLLRVAADPAKDQTYMLAALSPSSLARMRFPLAELTKPEVRALAASADLPVASRAESQDLCFLAGTGKARFLARHAGLDDAPGEIVSSSGEVLGAHPGFQHFTVGQRKGLGVQAVEPLYVLRTSASSNRVVVGIAGRAGRPRGSPCAARGCIVRARRSTPFACGTTRARSRAAWPVLSGPAPTAGSNWSSTSRSTARRRVRWPACSVVTSSSVRRRSEYDSRRDARGIAGDVDAWPRRRTRRQDRPGLSARCARTPTSRATVAYFLRTRADPE